MLPVNRLKHSIIKMTDSANKFHLYLDTRHATNRKTPNNVFFNVNLGNQRRRVSQIALQKISFANLYSPIQDDAYGSTYYNAFAWAGNGGNYSVQVPEGYYTGSTLASALQTLMRASGDTNFTTGTVTYSSVTLKLTFTPSANTIAILDPSTYIFNYQLGFSAATTAAASATSDMAIRIDGPEYVDVRVSLIEGARSFHGYLASSSVMARVHLTEPYGNIIFNEPNSIEVIRVNPEGFSEMQIELLQPDGRAFTLPENAHVNYTFLLS